MQRREQKRAYKETPRPMGVYRVLNTESGKTLLGSSTNLPGILNRQKFQLELGSHPSCELQEDWNRLGPQAFEFETLDVLDPPEGADRDSARDLETLEEMWLERLALPDELRYAPAGRRRD